MEEALRIFAAGPAGMLLVGVVAYFALQRKRRQADAQKEVQLALLSKFASGEELTRFLATDEGRRLVDVLAVPPGARNPRQKAIGMATGSCILLMMAIGFAGWMLYSQEQFHVYVVPAVFFVSLGVGLLIGAALTNRFAAKEELGRKGDR